MIMEISDEDKKKKVELIHVAIKQLMDESGKDGDEDNLLPRLLAQLELLEKDENATHIYKYMSKNNESTPSPACESEEFGCKEVNIDEVVNEIRRVRRQNNITHALLSVLIVVTVYWQLSEVSMLLAIKEMFTNPIKTIADVIKSVFKWRVKKPLSPMPTVSVLQLPPLAFERDEG